MPTLNNIRPDIAATLTALQAETKGETQINSREITALDGVNGSAKTFYLGILGYKFRYKNASGSYFRLHNVPA